MAAPSPSIGSRLFLPAISLCWRGIDPFRPAAEPDHWACARHADPILDRDRAREWAKASGSDVPGGDNFTGIFFSRNAGDDSALHGDFFRNLLIEDRRAKGVVSAIRSSRPGLCEWRSYWEKCSAAWCLRQPRVSSSLNLLAPLVGIKLGVTSFLIAIAVTLIVSFALSGLGFCIAWRMSSTQGFHVIMNLFLILTWFLSAPCSPPAAHGVMVDPAVKMGINPLTYGVSALRRALYFSSSANLDLPPWSVCIGVSLAFAAGNEPVASLPDGAAGWRPICNRIVGETFVHMNKPQKILTIALWILAVGGMVGVASMKTLLPGKPRPVPRPSPIWRPRRS